MSQPLSPRVLVVEDDPDIGAVYERYLTRLGCQLAIARTGHEAIVLANQLEPQVAFVDTMLPDMLGTSIVEYLRVNALTARCRIVVASGLDLELQDTIADAVMPKPFTGADLAEMLRRFAPDRQADPAPTATQETVVEEGHEGA